MACPKNATTYLTQAFILESTSISCNCLRTWIQYKNISCRLSSLMPKSLKFTKWLSNSLGHSKFGALTYFGKESRSISVPWGGASSIAEFILKFRSKKSKSSFSSSRSNFGSLVFGSKGNHFHSRKSTTCATPNFGSFPIVLFNFEGAKKFWMWYTSCKRG